MTAIRTGAIRRTFYAPLAALAALALAHPVTANPIAELQAHDGGAGVVASATGGGHLLIGTLDVNFAFSAGERADGSAHGKFRHSVVLSDQLVEFYGDVSCISVDSENGRAWIGGTILRNNSEHPSFTTERTQPGRDIWFRVLDNTEGSGEPDRSTFVGFEGDAMIITSLEYCAVQPWPADNERTSPIIQGNIQVRP